MSPSQVSASGPGLDPAQCRAGAPLSIKVDASKSAKAPLGVNIRSDKGKFRLGSRRLGWPGCWAFVLLCGLVYDDVIALPPLH